MVVKILFYSFIAGLLLLLYFDTYPAYSAYSSCQLDLTSSYYQVKAYSRERAWSQYRQCEEGYNRLIVADQCVQDTQKRYITGKWLFWFVPARPKINNIIREHNPYCQEYIHPVYELDITQ